MSDDGAFTVVMIIIIAVSVLLCAGTPDLYDAIIIGLTK
jgi:hypothetical protein